MPWHRRSNAFGAAAHGSGTCCASPLRHLRAGVAAHSGGAAARCRSYVDSRFSLKQRPRLLCGGMASAQGFLSTWSLEPTAIPEEVDRDVLPSPAPEIHLSVARCCCRQDPAASRGGPWRWHQGQAGERPRFSTRRTGPSAAQGCLVSIGNGNGRGRGPLPFKAKESVSYYLGM